MAKTPIPDQPNHSPAPSEIRWIGGVVQVRGCSRRREPLRVAAWVCRRQIVGAAIVDGHGPTVLRELLDELLASTAEDRRATRLVVWPNARAAFRDIAYPPVSVEHDKFLSVVIEDLADFGQITGALPVRSASGRPAR